MDIKSHMPSAPSATRRLTQIYAGRAPPPLPGAPPAPAEPPFPAPPLISRGSLPLDALPSDVLIELFKMVDVQFALRLVCRALRDAHPKKTTTSVRDIVASVSLLAWAHACGYTNQAVLTKKAARNGRLGALKWLQHVYPLNCDGKACMLAAQGGHLETLKWLNANHYPWNCHTCDAAAGNGHLACLDWAYEQQCNFTSVTLVMAAQGGHTSCVEWLLVRKCGMRPAAMEAAAAHGHLNILRLLRLQYSCPWDSDAPIAAASYGHLDCLKFLLRAPDTCPWSGTSVTAAAAEHGHVHVLKWLITRNGDLCKLRLNACRFAALRGHIPVLELARDRDGFVFDHADLCKSAATTGQLATLKWLVDHGCPVSECASLNAANNGHLDVLMYLKARFPNRYDAFPRKAMVFAAQGGHAEVVEWLHANNTVLTECVACAAAQYGFIDILRWALRQGCNYEFDELVRHSKLKERDLTAVQAFLTTLGELRATCGPGFERLL